MDNSTLDIEENETINLDNESVSHCNFTFLVLQWGSQHENRSISILVTIALCIVFVIGIVGNTLTIIVIVRHKGLHTATNFYLGSLAISDLLLLLTGFPQEVYLTWYRFPYVFGETFCRLRGMLSEVSTNASILTIVAFTMKRFLAICHPIKAHTASQLTRALRVILILWITAFICGIPQVLQAGVIYMECGGVTYKPELYSVCTITNPITWVFETYTIAFFISPMIVITILYAKIGLRLRRQSVQLHSERTANLYKSRKDILKMLGK